MKKQRWPRNHARRNARRKMAKRIVQGQIELRVSGSERAGFHLGGVVDSGLLNFVQTWDRQKDAVAYGERAFGQKARKLLLPSQEQPAAA